MARIRTSDCILAASIAICVAALSYALVTFDPRTIRNFTTPQETAKAHCEKAGGEYVYLWHRGTACFSKDALLRFNNDAFED